MRDRREAFAGLVGPKVVVELGDEDDHPARVSGPRGDLVGRRAVKRRRKQDDALDVVVAPVLQREFGAERPPHEPRAWQPTLADEVHGGGDVEHLGRSPVERPVAGAARRRGAARVEPEHREVCQCGEPSRGLAEDVRVHEPARRGQRVEGHERRHRRAVLGESELAHEGETVDGLELDVLSARGQQHGAAYLHQAILQQCVCQCRRAARSAASPRTPSARHTTR
ncbi:hypothetical protein SRABI128_05473 [Microbacterium sp. Bi128]|nr:hypothetical protein SRABI128_05473 [Microbacterium sp. Bi128]